MASGGAARCDRDGHRACVDVGRRLRDDRTCMYAVCAGQSGGSRRRIRTVYWRSTILSANARLRCVINGGGIAGPTLAYWLRRLGHDVLLIEEAPSIRTGGYVVDFWGVGYDVAEKMGLLPRIHELGYPVREVRFVDERGRRTGGFSTDVF